MTKSLANSRMSLTSDGRILYELKRTWSDGSTHIAFDPMTFLERLAALIPREICGRPFYTQILNVFKRDVEAAGIDKDGVHIHGLRRTFATRLIRAGADPKTVQTLLGHSTLDLTLQLYTDAKAMDLKGAIDKLPSLEVKEPTLVYRAVG